MITFKIRLVWDDVIHSSEIGELVFESEETADSLVGAVDQAKNKVCAFMNIYGANSFDRKCLEVFEAERLQS